MKFHPTEALKNQQRRIKCAVTGRADDPDGFFVELRELEILDTTANKHVVTTFGVDISAAAAKEMARQLGWLSPAEAEEMADRINEMGAEIASLSSLLEKLETFADLKSDLEAVAA